MIRLLRIFALALAPALALAASAPAQAQAQDAVPTARQERLLSVVGEGTVRARPDMAVIGVGVLSDAAGARAALSANTEAMNRVLEAMREGGIESRDLQTSGFSVEPIYTQPPGGYDGSQPFEPKIVGYRVRNELTVRIRDLAKTGEILDQAITLGANSITGPTFTVSDPTPLEDQARRAAMRDAIRKGELYAEAGEVGLGPIVRIDESIEQWPQPLPMVATARESFSDAKVPVESGEISYRAHVSVAWRLAD